MLLPIYLSLIKLNTLEFIILTINLISLKSLQKMKFCDLLFVGRPKLIIKKILLLEVQIFILHYIHYLESY
jgi:hypothetical protein